MIEGLIDDGDREGDDGDIEWTQSMTLSGWNGIKSASSQLFLILFIENARSQVPIYAANHSIIGTWATFVQINGSISCVIYSLNGLNTLTSSDWAKCQECKVIYVI